MSDTVLAPAPVNNHRGIALQPEEFRKTGIFYEISDEICPVENCGVFTYTATYQGRDWEACYYCKVKRHAVGVEHGSIVWSGFSIMI